MKLPSIEKRVDWLMEAIDKNLPTELPKTEEDYMALIQSVVRPVVKLRVEAMRNEDD